MAYQIMVRTDQLFAAKTTDFLERQIAVLNNTVQIGCRNKLFVIFEVPLVTRY